MSFVSSPTAPQLGEGALLVLTAFRCMAAGCDQSEVAAAFESRLGVAGRAALGALLLLVREIGTIGGRKVLIAAPGSCRLTADELSTLALLAAAQSRDEPRVAAHIAWLLAGRDSETARAAVLAVGRLFAGAGLALDNLGIEISRPPSSSRHPRVKAVSTS